jgi:ubiquinone/menaquinone biosynthesis C-methylase UbiE
MNSPDYLQHETEYLRLKQQGHKGWGGDNFDRRMQGWNATVETLTSSTTFPKSGAKILELGSGAGDSLIPFAQKGYDVTALEISPTGLQWAVEKFSTHGLRGIFVQHNLAEPLPFEDASFDVVLDATCLHCLIGTHRNDALKEVHRVLTKGGFFLVSHMVNDPRELGEETTFNAATRIQERDGAPYRSMPTFTQLTNELNSTGFKIIREEVRSNSWWDHAEIWCVKT